MTASNNNLRPVRLLSSHKLLQGLVVWSGLYFSLFASTAFAQSSGSDFIEDWEKKQDAEQRLTVFGDDLMGEGIDPHTGTIVFSHVDVDVPGNSALPVRIERKLTQGEHYKEGLDVEFADWQLVVPEITAISTQYGNWRSGIGRCSVKSNLFPRYEYQANEFIETNSYMNGVHVSVPGAGQEQLITIDFPETPATFNAARPPQFPANSHWITKNNWQFSCISLAGGREGFKGVSPDGSVYEFTRDILRDASDFKSTGLPSSMDRREVAIVATRVTDVHGNTVDYTYDSLDRLTKILASDGREINLFYAGTDKLISSVESEGRTWTYTYANTTFIYPDWNLRYGQLSQSKVLRTVTQPDQKSWTFNLDNMQAKQSPDSFCGIGTWNVGLTHPYGTSATYHLGYHEFRVNVATQIYKPRTCLGAGIDFENDSPSLIPLYTYRYPALAVAYKKLALTDGTNLQWNFAYGENAADRTNWSKITDPTGNSLRYEHFWTGVVEGGVMKFMEVLDSNDAVVKREDYIYADEDHLGWAIGGAKYTSMKQSNHRKIATTTTQGGDTYYSETDYNSNYTSPDYSFGSPIQTRVWSNVTTTPRISDTVYEHNKIKWVLGLPTSKTINGREIATYAYNALGRKVSQTKYGAPQATFGYHNDGSMAWFEDANARRTSANDWKRGTPQQIVRADNTSLYQYVDGNGWLTSSKDALGSTTTYARDNMGRLTEFTPPAGRAPTSVGYSFGASTVQTITKAQSQSTITYDSMFRPNLVQSQDLSTGSSSFINTEYDGMGRVIFTSFPSISSSSTAGTGTSYDGLGRVVSTTETVSPYASTSTEYLSGHKTRVTDPGGNQTTQTKNGFGELTKILQPMGVNTDMALNPWGEIESLRQWGTQNGTTVDQTHTYVYDTQRRLCRHHTPESGDTLSVYDAAGQMISLARGQSSGSGCATPSGTAQVSLGYDQLGRATTTTYSDSTTPDIIRSYDLNGNVLAVNRGAGASAVNWAYGYDAHNTLTSEALILDGKAYASAYGYNGAGHMMWRTLPSGRVLAFENDGFGRQTLIAGGVANPNAGATTTTNTTGDTTTGSTEDGDLTCDLGGATVDEGEGYNGVTGEDLYLSPESMTVGGEVFTPYYDPIFFPPAPPDPVDPLPVCEEPPVDNGATPPPPPPGNTYTETAPAFIADMTNLYASGMGYHPSGPLSGMTYGNGQVFSQTLNARLQPAHVQSSFGGNIALDMTYSYNNLGKVSNVLNAAITGDNRTYNYDALGRLTSATGPWGAGHTTGLATYTYDALGNMQGKTVGPRVMDMAYGPNNRLISHTDNIGGARSLSYDARGNVTQLGGLFFTYDMSDQPTYISGTASGTYKYDGNLKRVKSTVNGKTIYNVYDAGGTLIHIDAVTDGKATDYIGKVARITTLASVDSITYLHTDQLGSANTGTDENGLVTWREQYTPFGITLTSPLVNNDLAGFTGHIKDSATGLNYMQARYYDPFIGRFLSTDPIGFSPQRPEMFGRYTYVGNDPVNLIDPNGESARGAAKAAVAAMAIDISVPDPSDAAWPKWAGYAIAGAVAGTIIAVTNDETGESGSHTTPEGKEVRDHGKKGSGEEYIEGQGHSGESVDGIFGEGSETFDDGGHDNASGEAKTPTEVTVSPNGDWARTNTETGEIIQVNDRNNPRQPIPEPK